ncbi:MAG: hypothetical protein ACI4K9_08660 [Candidatus Fimenecus sp.]
MELHKTSERGLYAHLSKQELSAYQLTFDELNPQDARTEALIGAILTRAEKTLGWALPPRGKLFVDALPGTHGDTILLLTARTAPTRYRVKKQPFTFLCRTASSDTVLAVLRRVQSPPFSDAVCRLYRDESVYFLQVSFPTADALRAGRAALAEYGEVCACDARTQAYLHEYAVLIDTAP